MNKPVTDLKPEAEVTPDPLALMRVPFPDSQISKLPKQSKAQSDEVKNDRSKGVNCKVCGGWHHKNAVHLDYVGHAALTNRLLDVDPHWTWEPVAFGPDGLPALDRNGGLWIRLTVSDMTRLGYGHADGKQGGDAVKEAIGDALRNAAMRFGAALDLWHKGDLHADDEPPPPSLEERAITHLRACAVDRTTFKDAWEANHEGWKKTLDREAYGRVVAEMKRLAAGFPKEEAPPRADEDGFGLNGDDVPEFA